MVCALPKMRKYLYVLITFILLTNCQMQPQKIELEKSKDSLLIGFTGDVMLGRLVNEQVSMTNYAYPWGNVLPLLKATDLNVINLETTLTTSNKIVPKVFNYKADPDKVESLTEAKVDVANLANNHILDFDIEGMVETISVLDKAGIKHVGAGKDKTEASRALIIKKKNITIGILGYTDNEPDWEAKENTPGVNYIEINDESAEKVAKEVKALKSKVDIVIFSIHWGPNMKQAPSEEFRSFAHEIIDAGVDIFHGHSAHIFQGIEIYNKKAIFYDTGDFVDDYYVTPELRNDQSFFYLIEVDKKGITKIQLVPTLISAMQVNLAEGVDYNETISRVKILSKDFGTSIIEVKKGVFVVI